METPLSAAEVITLRSPDTEQVKIILPLLLKDLVLQGWVDVRKGSRASNFTVWIAFGLFAAMLLVVHTGFGLITIFLVGLSFYQASKPKTLLSLTPAGEQMMQRFRPNSPFLVQVLHTVAFARPHDKENCTTEEWRKHLGNQYPDNAAFHREFLLRFLEQQGLVKRKGHHFAKCTQAGDAALERAEAEIERGIPLPQMLRQGDPEAAVIAASLGSLLLLVPGMEGYFHTLMHTAGLPGMDLQQQERMEVAAISSSGSSDPVNADRPEHDPESDNGLDWGDNADFLDGDLGDGTDAGVGDDGGGCGVGSDGSDGGGCSGDGGCSGCGGGCGGGD